LIAAVDAWLFSQRKRTQALARASAQHESAVSTVMRWVTWTKKATPATLQIHNAIISSEAKLVAGPLMFMQETLAGFLKGALSIRSAWSTYDNMWTLYKQWDAAGRPSTPPSSNPNLPIFDKETAGALQFGIGNFSLVISILPARIRKLVSIFGFPTDRKLALAYLNECHDGAGCRGPVAGLFLLFYHVMLQSFFLLRPEHHVSLAERIIETNLTRFGNSGLFLFMKGRMQRLKRQLPEAIKSFQLAEEGNRNWAQLEHLCYYELAWTNMFMNRYDDAMVFFNRLLQENKWSKAVYAYLLGACAAAQGDYSKASSLFRSAPTYIQRKYGGKVLSAEQFVERKISAYVGTSDDSRHGVGIRAPELELMFLWNGFSQMPMDALERSLARVEAELDAHIKSHVVDEQPLVLRLIRGSILKELGRVCVSPGWNELTLLLTLLSVGVCFAEQVLGKYLLPLPMNRTSWFRTSPRRQPACIRPQHS
jgi:tetratricopeptide (TPR) repeat protein